MALAALIADIHLGVRNNGIQFHNQFGRFFTETFFPALRARGITQIINAGDTFDRQNNIDFVTLSKAKEYFLDPLREFEMEVIVGNHDRYYKSTNAINACSLLFREYSNIRTYVNASESASHPGILYIPWINRENAEKTRDAIRLSSSDTVIGHLELSGFKMYKFSSISDGLDPKFFNKFDNVYTGHFHHRNKVGNVEYVGAATQQTWSDCDDWRGFHILDLETHKIVESIENPFHMFEKVLINDDKHIPLLEDVKDKFIKIEISQDVDPSLIESLKKSFQNDQAADVAVDDRTKLVVPDIELESADILTLMDRYVKMKATNPQQGERLLKMMQRWYSKALEEE